MPLTKNINNSDQKDIHVTMKRMNDKLIEASNAYYNNSQPIMSDKEYDELYDKFCKLEKETGIMLPNSITQMVGAVPTPVSSLKKVKHKEKALSLDKTKSREDLASWLGKNNGCMSWKLDGITLVVTYKDGKLLTAVTRGNGEIGEDVTHNAPYIKGLPKKINKQGEFIVRGEALMTFADFDKVNASLPVDQKYANPRNLASGTIRALDPKVVKERGITFFAFESVTSIDKYFVESLDKLKNLGFNVVPHVRVNNVSDIKKNSSEKIYGVKEAIQKFSDRVDKLPFPTDGLVLQIDDIEYAKSLGTTGKFPRSGKAFKWKDETAETVIREIVWQPSRTGLINPVAVFDPVNLEGTVVKRATCNNLSFMQNLNLTVGSKIRVYKANMIIPTIESNLDPTIGDFRSTIPVVCPCCGYPTSVVNTGKANVLMCKNSNCSAKNLNSIAHFVSRDAMNIVGIANNTIDLLNQNGLLSIPNDLFELYNHPEIADIDGLGKGSFKNIVESVESAKNTTLNRYIYAWGIDQIGRRASKDISDYCKGSIKVFVKAMDSKFDWTVIDGFGKIMNSNLHNWWKIPTNRNNFINCVKYLHFEEIGNNTVDANTNVQSNNGISGKTFCVTGSVYIFKNRNEVGEYIEKHGGKLATSVTKKTDYLMTNDTTSGSNKNKKAAELGVPIITEEDLLKLGGD